jgi:type 1 glutamine amidotransferase
VGQQRAIHPVSDNLWLMSRALPFLVVAALACSSGAHVTVRDASADNGKPDAAKASAPLQIVVFSKTAGFRHDSIAPATRALADIADKHQASFESTEDAAVLVSKLGSASVVVFLMTTGDVLDATQQSELERYMREGGGFVGVHSSADTEYDWPFYRDLNGAWFADHPAVQEAKLTPTDHELVSFLPRDWLRTDEWYNFKDNPQTRGVSVLLRLDESSYSGGTHGTDHPIAWAHAIEKGRAFYTGLGHTNESWQEPLFLEHVERGLLWAAGR